MTTPNRALFTALSGATSEAIRRAAWTVAEPDPDRLAALHDRLADDADQAGLLDLTYRIVDSPYGALLVVATPIGVVRVAFEREDHDAVLGDLADRLGPRILRDPRRTDDAARQLDDYFAGHRRRFDLAVDLRLAHGFRRTVLDHLLAVDYGTTASYRDVAQAIGHPKAVRAVGTACAHNPVPIVVPCHRVVRSDGTIGQYLGGVETKAALLVLEGARL